MKKTCARIIAALLVFGPPVIGFAEGLGWTFGLLALAVMFALAFAATSDLVADFLED